MVVAAIDIFNMVEAWRGSKSQKYFGTTTVYSFCTVFIYLYFILEVILSASDVDRKRGAFFLPFSLFQHIPGLDESNFP